MNTPAYQSMQKIQSALAYTSNVLNEQDYVKPTLANDPEYQRLKTATRFIALSAGYAVGSNRGAGNAAKGMNSGRKPTQVKPSADGDGMTVQLGGYTVRQDGSVVGPKGGASQSVGFTQKGDVVYRTQSGGYFTVSKGVRTNITAGEVTTNKPHGNTLGNQPTYLYKKYDVNENFLKNGITVNPNTRYTKKELDLGYLEPSNKAIPRQRAERIERFLNERKGGVENKEPWAGKANPNDPRYDPNYIPKHKRDKNK